MQTAWKLKKKNGTAGGWKQLGNVLNATAKAASIAKTAVGVAKIAGLLNVEFKAIASNVGSSPTATGEVNLLSGCVRGTDYNNRDGRSILLKSIELKLDIKQNSSATKPTHVRLMVVLDKMPQGTIPAVSDILDTSAGTDYCCFLRNLTNRKRFIIIKDEHIWVDPYNQMSIFEYYKKLNMHSIFNAGNAGTIADVQEGAIYLVLASTATAAQEPNVTGNYRLRFVDN